MSTTGVIVTRGIRFSWVPPAQLCARAIYFGAKAVLAVQAAF